MSHQRFLRASVLWSVAGMLAIAVLVGSGRAVASGGAFEMGRDADSASSGFVRKEGTTVFPIGIYEFPKEAGELKAMADAGINLIRCHNVSQLDQAAGAGLLGWVPISMQTGVTEALRAKIETLVDHPALAVWEGPDEIVHLFTAWSGLYRKKGVYKTPDAWKRQTPEAIAYSEEQAKQIIPKIREAIRLIRELDRAKRPIWINEAAESDLKFVRQYVDVVDVIGCDIYPVRDKKRNVPVVGDATERWKKVGRHQKPVWMVLQAFSWHELGAYYGHTVAAYPSFAESRFMAYDVIVHGARGILYWGSHYLKSDAFRRSLYALTRELSALQPFLVAPAYAGARVSVVELDRETAERGVVMSVRRVGDEWLVILVNEDDRPHLGVEVVGLDALDGRALELLYGDENARVEAGEFVTRLRPLEVKVFSTSRRWEAKDVSGRDYP